MTQKIKLSEKQLAAVIAVQQQRAQLNNMLQDVNQKEALILELIFEMKEVKGEVSALKLEEDHLVFDLTEKTEKVKPKKQADKTAKAAS